VRARRGAGERAGPTWPGVVRRFTAPGPVPRGTPARAWRLTDWSASGASRVGEGVSVFEFVLGGGRVGLWGAGRVRGWAGGRVSAWGNRPACEATQAGKAQERRMVTQPTRRMGHVLTRPGAEGGRWPEKRSPMELRRVFIGRRASRRHIGLRRGNAEQGEQSPKAHEARSGRNRGCRGPRS